MATSGVGRGLGARGAIAVRRSRRAMAAAAVVCTLGGLLAQLGHLRSVADAGSGRSAHLGDSSAALALADRAHAVLAAADSQYERALRASENVGSGASVLAPGSRLRYDSLQALADGLDALIERARRAPLPVSYRDLAAAQALRGEPAAAALVDSLARIDRRREALGPKASGSPEYVALISADHAVGGALLELAGRRRGAVAREIASVTADAPEPALAIDTAGPRRLRDSLRDLADVRDTALRSVRAQLRAQADSAAAVRAEAATHPPIVAFAAAALLLGLSAIFGGALWSELKRPTLATAREAEDVVGAPVIAVVRDGQRVPRPSALDPFRMLYLGLTATGTRARTVVLTGDEPGVTSVVAGRLAIAAGSDARATLVVDADAKNSAVAAYFDERPEPGFSDAIAGVRLWRETATPIGASDGVQIDFVPAGSPRPAPEGAAAIKSAKEEFSRFRSGFDFSVIVAPTEASLGQVALVADSPLVVLCLRIGATRVGDACTLGAQIRARGATLHGVLLWDAAVPSRASRATQVSRALARSAERSNTEAAGV